MKRRERERLKREAKKSILAFGKYYLPHYFSDKNGTPISSAEFHKEICEILEGNDVGSQASPPANAAETAYSIRVGSQVSLPATPEISNFKFQIPTEKQGSQASSPATPSGGSREYWSQGFSPQQKTSSLASFAGGLRAAWEAPRGHAKSTIISLTFPLWCICEKKKRFIVLVSDTLKQAEMFLSFIIRELEENEELKADYKEDLKPLRDSQGNLVKWTDGEIVTSSGVKALARGMGTSLRGIRNQQDRPDLIIVDDPENDELVETDYRRRKNLDWFNESLQNTLDRDGDVIVLGTRIHHDCLVSKLLTDPEYKRTWKGKTYKAINIDQNGKEYALWESWWSLERLHKKKSEIKSIAFEKEFQNNPINPEDQRFREGWVGYYSMPDIGGMDFDVYGFVDPAISRTSKNDYSAIVVIGVASGGGIYVLHALIERLTPRRLIDNIIGIYRDFPRMIRLGIESNAFQLVIKELVDEESRKEKLFIPTAEVKQTSDKILRIGRLSPLMEQGLIHFCLDPECGNQGLLVEQLLHFPMGSHDDGPDALEGAVSLARRSAVGRLPRVGGRAIAEPVFDRERLRW